MWGCGTPVLAAGLCALPHMARGQKHQNPMEKTYCSEENQTNLSRIYATIVVPVECRVVYGTLRGDATRVSPSPVLLPFAA